MPLNQDSTHPNPWRPPNEMEKFRMVHQWGNIYKEYEGKEFKQNFSWFEDKPFNQRMWVGFKKGVALGIMGGFWDQLFYSRPKTPNAKYARFAMVALPTAALPLSYIGLREVALNVHRAFGREKKEYASSSCFGALGPATIAYLTTKSKGFSFGVWSTLSMLGILHAFHVDLGYLSYGARDKAFRGSFPYFWNLRYGLNYNEGWERDPEWKKWVDEDNAGQR